MNGKTEALRDASICEQGKDCIVSIEYPKLSAGINYSATFLRQAAVGRREYAKIREDAVNTSDANARIIEMLEHEAEVLEAAAEFILTGDRANFLRFLVPSWRWKELDIDL